MAGVVPSLLVQGVACGGMQQGQQVLLGRPGPSSAFSGLQLRRGRAVLEFPDLGCRDGWRVYAARGREPGIPRRNRRSARSGQDGGAEGSDVILVVDKSSGQTSTSGKVTESVATPAVEPRFADQGGYIGSPLLWIGVGVGLSAFFSWAAGRFKKYAMQQVLKSMAVPKGMGGMPVMGSKSATGPSPFSFPPIPTPPPVVSASSQTINAQAFIKPLEPVQPETTAGAGSMSTRVSSKPSAFTDVPASTIEEEKVKAAAAPASAAAAGPASAPSTSSKTVEEEQQPRTSFFQDTEVVDNGAGWENNTGRSSATSDAKPGSVFTVQALERMMEDPMVQKMVYPYLPEEMRNPSTFKWMLQNPQYRQQLQDMLNNLGGDGTWDNRMSDMLKNFDLNSTEVKQQFEQIGLTPEEVVAKIMANPDVALAFQNPRVQAAIMDCSQNPLNITKYQNDKEVMDVFNKISELFPGMTGAPYEV